MIKNQILNKKNHKKFNKIKRKTFFFDIHVIRSNARVIKKFFRTLLLIFSTSRSRFKIVFAIFFRNIFKTLKRIVVIENLAADDAKKKNFFSFSKMLS